MRPSPRLVLLASLAGFALNLAAAVRLPATGGGFVTVEEPILVTTEGIRHVPPGAPVPELLAWKTLDLRALAVRHPEVERAAHGAAGLRGGRQPAKPLARISPDASQHEICRTVRQQTPLVVVTSPGPETPASATTSTIVSERSRTTTEVRDETPAELDTTIEGLLTVISDYQNPLSSRRLRELRTTPDRLISSVRELGSLLPGDHEVAGAVRALEKLQADAAVSVDAQRALARFLAHARAQAGAWARAAGES